MNDKNNKDITENDKDKIKKKKIISMLPKLPPQIQLDEVTSRRLETIQLKINLHNKDIQLLQKDLKELIMQIESFHKINLKDYEVDFDRGILILTKEAQTSRTERGV